MKNILVTGGAGFVGSHLVDALLDQKQWRVFVIDDFNDFYDPAIKRRNLQPHGGNPNFDLIEQNICDCGKLRNVFAARSFDAIVHLAARAGVRPSVEKPALYAETNVAGTLNLLEMAREFGVKQFVFGSSSSVYGINCSVPFNENEPVATPISPYAATKAAGELLCHTYAHLHQIRTICLRFFTVYGARQRPDLAIHKFTNLISAGKPIPFFGDGRTRRDYTFVDDIIQGVLAAIEYRASNFEIINLGESRTVELRELIGLLEENIGKKAVIERLPPQPGDVPQTFADITKARRFLGYQPQTQIEIGIAKFVEWYNETRLLENQKV